MNLDKAHRKIEHDKISREVRTAVENKVIPKVQSACLAATALVLHGKFGFGKQRLNKYIEEVFNIFESIYLEYTEFEDIKRCIYDELGVDFDAIEEKRMNEDKRKAYEN